MYTNHQLLLFVSLSFYVVELLLYRVVRGLLKKVDDSGGLTEDIRSLMNRVQGKEIMMFTSIYVVCS